MELSALLAEPQLVKLTIDNEEIVKEYGDALEFYTWDRQPLDVFFKVATAAQNDPQELAKVLTPIILNNEGKPVMDGKMILPAKVMMLAITKMMEQVGK